MSATRLLAGRQVHPIGLGCMNLSWAYGKPRSEKDEVRLLNYALASPGAGINLKRASQILKERSG